MQNHFIHYFQKHLEQLKTEIEAYPSEESLWLQPDGINNSAGNLCCHLIGNLNHFIGKGIGKTAYFRNRPLEFTIKNVNRVGLIRQIDETSKMIEEVIGEIEDLEASFPEELFGEEGSISFFLFRLLGHLAYHVGQMNYHRRLLTG